MAAWIDYDRDAFLDLYVGHWTFIEGFEDLYNILYRNQGDGTFVDVTAAAGFPTHGEGSTVGVLAQDFDGDGWTDIYLPTLQGPPTLYLNDEGVFRRSLTSGIDNPSEGWGSAAGDLDNDGDLDLFQPGATNVGVLEGDRLPERSALYLNLGDGQFIDATEGAGTLSLTTTSVFFARIFDFDNDGDLDLMPAEGLPSLFENTGVGRFIERPFQSGLAGVGALSETDGDGFLESWSPLGDWYRFQGNDNHHLRIHLEGTASARDGQGARVFATTGEKRQMQELHNADGWCQDQLVVHFGLGEHTTVDELEIRWTSGQVDFIDNIPADQEIRVIEGRGEWYPAPRTVWTEPPPESVTFGSTTDFIATARPALFEPTATITSITGDLSSLGGPSDVPLTDNGDGTYTLVASFVVGGESKLRDVEVFILQETSLGEHWINLSRNITVEGDPFTAVLEEYTAEVPEAFSLEQNYPNPFNSSTVIPFSLPRAGDVTVEVFNLAGQKVATLVDGFREAGSYSLSWDGRGEDGRSLASGVYLYRLRARDRVYARQLLLLK